MESPGAKPLKWYKGLSTARGRRDAGAFAVEGERAVRQILASNPDAVREILVFDEPPAFLGGYPVHRVSERQFAYVSNSRAPQGLLAVVDHPAGAYSASLPEDTGDRVLVMEDIQDPGNVGTLLRSAAAFGFSGAVMSEKCADPFSPKCVQAAAGSVLSVFIRRTSAFLGLVAELRGRGYSLVAADIDGRSPPSVLETPARLALALGNEGAGLSMHMMGMADHSVRIPVATEKAESLNVAACGAICMYLARQKSR